MKFLRLPALFCFVATLGSASWVPAEIHPKVFHLVDCWWSDASRPVVTEVNLDAVRANRNEFDPVTVKDESGWITCHEDAETFRFRVVKEHAGEFTVLYQENGGGSLTSQCEIRFSLTPRTVEIDGHPRSITVLRVAAISGTAEGR